MLQKYKLPVSNHGTGSKFIRFLVFFSDNHQFFKSISKEIYIFATMKTLLIILCIIIAVKYWPYIIAFPFAIVKAVYYIVTGRDNDPEVVELKEAKKREIAAKKKARKEKRKYAWRIPTSLFGFFR